MRAREKCGAVEPYTIALWLPWEACSIMSGCLVPCLPLKSRLPTQSYGLEGVGVAAGEASYLPIGLLRPIQFLYTPLHVEFPGCTNDRLQDVYQGDTFIKKMIAFGKIEQVTSLVTQEMSDRLETESGWGRIVLNGHCFGVSCKRGSEGWGCGKNCPRPMS